jgi:hypothetical protein
MPIRRALNAVYLPGGPHFLRRLLACLTGFYGYHLYPAPCCWSRHGNCASLNGPAPCRVDRHDVRHDMTQTIDVLEAARRLAITPDAEAFSCLATGAFCPAVQPCHCPACPAMPNPVRMPLAEAARLLGTTPDALRKKIKRGHLQATRDNTGRLMVWINPPTEGGQESSRLAIVQAGQVDGLASQESSLVQPLRYHITTLKEQLARTEGHADEARRRADDLADRLAAVERERQADHAELGRLRAELEMVRALPWWRRLLGG